MTKFFYKFKKPCFDPFLVTFPIFGTKQIFLENPAFSRTSSYRSLAPYLNLEKTKQQLQENTQTDGRIERWKDRRMEGPTCHRILLATTRGPISFTPGNVVILFIIHELDTRSRDINADSTLHDCLFEAVKLTKNADPDKYGKSGYSIGFDAC